MECILTQQACKVSSSKPRRAIQVFTQKSKLLVGFDKKSPTTLRRFHLSREKRHQQQVCGEQKKACSRLCQLWNRHGHTSKLLTPLMAEANVSMPTNGNSLCFASNAQRSLQLSTHQGWTKYDNAWNGQCGCASCATINDRVSSISSIVCNLERILHRLHVYWFARACVCVCIYIHIYKICACVFCACGVCVCMQTSDMIWLHKSSTLKQNADADLSVSVAAMTTTSNPTEGPIPRPIPRPVALCFEHYQSWKSWRNEVDEKADLDKASGKTHQSYHRGPNWLDDAGCVWARWADHQTECASPRNDLRLGLACLRLTAAVEFVPSYSAPHYRLDPLTTGTKVSQLQPSLIPLIQ